MVLASKKGTYAICIVFPVLGLLAIVLRFLVRRARNGPWKIDDYLCIPAWVGLRSAITLNPVLS